MTKFMINNRKDALKTDINLFFTITNCRIAGSRSLTRPMNFKFMCLSGYWQYKLANDCAWISAVIVKMDIDLHCINSSPMLIAVKLITLGVELWSPMLITDHWKVGRLSYQFKSKIVYCITELLKRGVIKFNVVYCKLKRWVLKSDRCCHLLR